MYIPTSVLNAYRFAPKKGTRYSPCGVLFTRDDDGHPHAIANDGCMIIDISWEPRPPAPPSAWGTEDDPTKRYATIIPRNLLSNILESSRRDWPVYGGDLICLPDDDPTKLQFTDGSHVPFSAVDAKYPPYKKLFPTYEILAPEQQPGKRDNRAVRIALGAGIMIRAMQAMRDACESCEDDSFIFSVPVDPLQAITISVVADGGRIRATTVVMPRDINR